MHASKLTEPTEKLRSTSMQVLRIADSSNLEYAVLHLRLKDDCVTNFEEC